MTLVFLLLHIVTAVVDPFTHLGLVAAVVPFGSYYRTLWLGLGTIAFELLLAIVATSLLRHHIGARTWRAIHWLAYACWPVAVLHGIGTGTDNTAGWMVAIDILCIAAVLGAVAWRMLAAPPDPLAGERRDAAERASFGTGR
jgi:sulfoxide reductase heme-binding subunit YedZ